LQAGKLKENVKKVKVILMMKIREVFGKRSNIILGVLKKHLVIHVFIKL
jgi:hypothetical protein